MTTNQSVRPQGACFERLCQPERMPCKEFFIVVLLLAVLCGNAGASLPNPGHVPASWEQAAGNLFDARTLFHTEACQTGNRAALPWSRNATRALHGTHKVALPASSGPEPSGLDVHDLSPSSYSRVIRTLVMSVAVALTLEHYKRFLVSLRAHYAGDILIFQLFSEEQEAEDERMQQNAVDGEEVVGIDGSRVGGLPRRLRHQETESEKSAILKLCSLLNVRLLPFTMPEAERTWLARHRRFWNEGCVEGRYDYCLHAGFRDTFFQADPFVAIVGRLVKEWWETDLCQQPAGGQRQTSGEKESDRHEGSVMTDAGVEHQPYGYDFYAGMTPVRHHATEEQDSPQGASETPPGRTTPCRTATTAAAVRRMFRRRVDDLVFFQDASRVMCSKCFRHIKSLHRRFWPGFSKGLSWVEGPGKSVILEKDKAFFASRGSPAPGEESLLPDAAHCTKACAEQWNTDTFGPRLEVGETKKSGASGSAADFGDTDHVDAAVPSGSGSGWADHPFLEAFSPAESGDLADCYEWRTRAARAAARSQVYKHRGEWLSTSTSTPTSTDAAPGDRDESWEESADHDELRQDHLLDHAAPSFTLCADVTYGTPTGWGEIGREADWFFENDRKNAVSVFRQRLGVVVETLVRLVSSYKCGQKQRDAIQQCRARLESRSRMMTTSMLAHAVDWSGRRHASPILVNGTGESYSGDSSGGWWYNASSTSTRRARGAPAVSPTSPGRPADDEGLVTTDLPPVPGGRALARAAPVAEAYSCQHLSTDVIATSDSTIRPVIGILRSRCRRNKPARENKVGPSNEVREQEQEPSDAYVIERLGLDLAALQTCADVRLVPGELFSAYEFSSLECAALRNTDFGSIRRGPELDVTSQCTDQGILNFLFFKHQRAAVRNSGVEVEGAEKGEKAHEMIHIRPRLRSMAGVSRLGGTTSRSTSAQNTLAPVTTRKSADLETKNWNAFEFRPSSSDQVAGAAGGAKRFPTIFKKDFSEDGLAVHAHFWHMYGHFDWFTYHFDRNETSGARVLRGGMMPAMLHHNLPKHVEESFVQPVLAHFTQILYSHVDIRFDGGADGRAVLSNENDLKRAMKYLRTVVRCDEPFRNCGGSVRLLFCGDSTVDHLSEQGGTKNVRFAFASECSPSLARHGQGVGDEKKTAINRTRSRVPRRRLGDGECTSF